ncbi:MAG: CBS domain-containing protein, partial [Actinomycetia bacterium]|nr:CBS domain-containing protein [Actinomycetes bacterium]
RDDWANQPVADYMSREVVTVTTDTRLREVTEMLVEKQIHRVVVVDEEGGRIQPLAVISDTDLVYYMLNE